MWATAHKLLSLVRDRPLNACFSTECLLDPKHALLEYRTAPKSTSFLTPEAPSQTARGISLLCTASSQYSQGTRRLQPDCSSQRFSADGQSSILGANIAPTRFCEISQKLHWKGKRYQSFSYLSPQGNETQQGDDLVVSTFSPLTNQQDAEECTPTEEHLPAQGLTALDPERARLQLQLDAVQRPSALVQLIEAKVEADIRGLLATVLLGTGFVMVDFGVSNLLDIILGQSVLGAVCCILLGLIIVIYIKVNNWKIIRLWQGRSRK